MPRMWRSAPHTILSPETNRGHRPGCSDRALSGPFDSLPNLVVYGDVLEQEDGSVLITPKFTFAGKESEELSAVERAGLVGDNAIGDEIGPVFLQQSRAILSDRSQIIIHVLAGLVSLLADEPDAADSFREANRLATESGLPPSAALQFFLGQALLNTRRPESYQDAELAFEAALAVEPEYARAYVGLASTLYLQGRGEPEQRRALLLQAADNHERALDAAFQPEGPVLAARAHIGRGNAFLVLAREDTETYELQGRREYEHVLALAEPCDGGPSWWDPRSWGPWEGSFYSEPEYCDHMRELSAVAATVLANIDNVTRQSAVLGLSTGSAQGNRRVLRGGSFGLSARNARSVNRLLANPAVRSDAFGFRAARTYP